MEGHVHYKARCEVAEEEHRFKLRGHLPHAAGSTQGVAKKISADIWVALAQALEMLLVYFGFLVLSASGVRCKAAAYYEHSVAAKEKFSADHTHTSPSPSARRAAT